MCAVSSCFRYHKRQGVEPCLSYNIYPFLENGIIEGCSGVDLPDFVNIGLLFQDGFVLISFLVFQATDRNDIHAIVAAVCVISDSCQYHKEGRGFHFVGVDFCLHSF